MLLSNKALEYSWKIFGLWPFDNYPFGCMVLVSMVFTLIPFQCAHILAPIENFMRMDTLSDTIAELLILIKVFILFINKR